MKNPRKACAEYCMGLCRERVEYLEWYQEYCDRVRKQIKDVSRRRERGQEHTDPVLRHERRD